MAIELVSRTDTFEDWRLKTNRISTAVGDITNITTPTIRETVIGAGITTGSPTSRPPASSVWAGTPAEVTVSINEAGTTYLVDLTSGGAGYLPDDVITITGNRLSGTSPENDITFTVRSIATATGEILTFDLLTGTPQISVINVINRIREDVGNTETTPLTTTAQTVVGAINEIDEDIVTINDNIEEINIALPPIEEDIDSIEDKIGTETLDAGGADIIASLNSQKTTLDTINTEIGGSVAADYTGGSETTIIAALNAIAAITNVATLNDTYLRRSGVDAITGTLNVDEYGLTSGANTFLIKTGADNDNRIQISTDGNIGINRAPNTTYQVDVDGDLNATRLFYGGVDTDTKYLPATTDGSGNRVVSTPLVLDSSSGLTATNSVTFTGSVTLGASLLHSNTSPFTETIQDLIGGMVTGNTETGGIAAVYDDTNGKLNFAFTPEDETFQDIFGGMFTGNTETGGITSTYDDTAGKIDFAINPIINPSEIIARGVWDRTLTDSDDLTDGHFQIKNNGAIWLAATSKNSVNIDRSTFGINDNLYFNSTTKQYIVRVDSINTTTINSVDIFQLGVTVLAGDVPADGTASTMAHNDVPVSDISVNLIKHQLLNPAVNIADQSIDISKLNASGTRSNGFILRYRDAGAVWEDLPDASTTAKGIIEIATQSEADAGTSTVTAMTPALVTRLIDAATPDASTSRPGIIQIATASDATTGTNTTLAMTPKLVTDRIRALAPNATTSRRGLIEIATQNEADAGIDNTRAMTPALVQRRIRLGTPIASTSRRGLIQIANRSEADTGTNTTKAITPELLQRRIEAFTPVDATTTQQGVVQLATDEEVLDSTVADKVITVANAYAIVEQSVGNVFKRWLYHTIDGQPVSTSNSGTAFDCETDLTAFDYIEVGYNKFNTITSSGTSLSNPENRVGVSVTSLRVDDIPIGRSGTSAVPVGSAISKIGAVSLVDNTGVPLAGLTLFYAWIDPNDDNLLYIEADGASNTRVYIYHIIGVSGAP